VIRLYVVVEVQTEEAFVKGVLRPHLRLHGVEPTPIIVTSSRNDSGAKYKGGGKWNHWLADLERLLPVQTRSGAWVTTMFDLYGLPKDFPEREVIRAASTGATKVKLAEAAISAALSASKGHRWFIPYVQPHEFEALVLASLDGLAAVLDAPNDLNGLARLRTSLRGHAPEEVNDGPETAPSKRLLAHVPGYDKVLHGELALCDASLEVLCEACPHFGAWVERLCRLADAREGTTERE
jgi:hypothetical protein